MAQRDTVKCTISPQPSPDGRKVLQITVSAPKPRARKGAKPTVKAVKLPPPPTVEKGETVEPRAGVSLARLCTENAARMIAGRAAEIASMHDGFSPSCYDFSEIIAHDRARYAEACARGLDPRGFVPSWDAPRSSEDSENAPKMGFASAVNTAEMDAHNARVQPTVELINAHNALYEVKYGTGIAYPCHNDSRKVRRRCRTYGVCAARRPLHHACPVGCVNVDTPTGTVGALCRVPHGYAHGTVLHKRCQTASARPLWALTGNLAERKARAKFQKRIAREFVSGK